MSINHPINSATDTITQVQATSLLVSYWRLKESKKPKSERLIDDLPDELLLDVLLSKEHREKFENSSVLNRGIDALALRTRFIDDWLLHNLPTDALDSAHADCASIAKQSAKIVVNLGAGMDARPYRLQGLKKVSKYIEVDSNHELLELKHRILQTGGAMTGDSSFLAAASERAMKPHCSVIRLEADLEDLDKTRKRFNLVGLEVHHQNAIDFIAEGLFAYLDPHLHQKLLQLCHDMSGKGSRMILTVLDPAGVDNFQSMNSFQIPWRELVPVADLSKQAQQCGWKEAKIWPLNNLFAMYNRQKESDLKGYAILALAK
jgi:methyltransferase (TIGR00027 family)